MWNVKMTETMWHTFYRFPLMISLWSNTAHCTLFTCPMKVRSLWYISLSLNSEFSTWPTLYKRGNYQFDYPQPGIDRSPVGQKTSDTFWVYLVPWALPLYPATWFTLSRPPAGWLHQLCNTSRTPDTADCFAVALARDGNTTDHTPA